MNTTKMEFTKQELEALYKALTYTADVYSEKVKDTLWNNNIEEFSKQRRFVALCYLLWKKVDLAIAETNGMPF